MAVAQSKTDNIQYIKIEPDSDEQDTESGAEWSLNNAGVVRPDIIPGYRLMRQGDTYGLFYTSDVSPDFVWSGTPPVDLTDAAIEGKLGDGDDIMEIVIESRQKHLAFVRGLIPAFGKLPENARDRIIGACIQSGYHGEHGFNDTGFLRWLMNQVGQAVEEDDFKSNVAFLMKHSTGNVGNESEWEPDGSDPATTAIAAEAVRQGKVLYCEVSEGTIPSPFDRSGLDEPAPAPPKKKELWYNESTGKFQVGDVEYGLEGGYAAATMLQPGEYPYWEETGEYTGIRSYDDYETAYADMRYGRIQATEAGFPTWQQQLDAQIRDHLGVSDMGLSQDELPFGFIEPDQYKAYFRSGRLAEEIAREIADDLIERGWTY